MGRLKNMLMDLLEEAEFESEWWLAPQKHQLKEIFQ